MTTHILKTQIVFQLSDLEIVLKCFYHSTVWLRNWQVLEPKEEYLPGIKVTYPSISDPIKRDEYEKVISAASKDFRNQFYTKKKDSGYFVLKKSKTNLFLFVTEEEVWKLPFQLSGMATDITLGQNLLEMIEELGIEALNSPQPPKDLKDEPSYSFGLSLEFPEKM